MPFKDYQPAPAASPTATNSDAEQELVEALRRRDETAYRILVRRYTPLMLRLARPHVPSQAIAEEVVQDTWVAVLRGIDTFESRCRFATWLMRILLNTARKRGVREHTPVRWDALCADAEPMPAVEPSAEAAVLSAETRALLERAIRTLPERQRIVLVLCDVGRWPTEDVRRARHLDW
ncbi:MAG TPA: sigma-70 family RNA polymerase sigma factor [Pseudonocardiaceae bacterium]